MRPWTAALLGATLLAGCRGKGDTARYESKQEARPDDFVPALAAYLAKEGDLCVGRPTWPIDVDDQAFAMHAPDAVQLPVLERLGLAVSTRLVPRQDGVATPFPAVRRFRLTEAGRAHFLDRRTRLPVPPDDPSFATHADFCVARLSLDHIVAVEHGTEGAATVSYTYAVQAPPWTRDPELLRVFPAVARVIGGAHRAPLVEGFTRTPAGWVANELLSTPAPQPQAAR